jgi:hypothetical protein
MNEELWKDVRNYEDLYEVSNTGKIRAKRTGLILKLMDNGAGYMGVSLCKGGVYHRRYIHRLVAQAFIPNPEGKPQVMHLDHNSKNNHVSNLAWGTQKENTLQGIRDGRINSKPRGKTKKLTLEDRAKAVIYKKLGKGVQDTATLLGFPRTTISSVHNGRSAPEWVEFIMEELKGVSETRMLNYIERHTKNEVH